jgi:hypothetical protein
MNIIKKLSKIFNNRKKVVYTVITGNYDDLLTPINRNKDWDYICFTDDPDLESDFWQLIHIDNPENLSPSRLNRIYKILPHIYLKKYDYSLYVDGNFRIIGDVDEYVARYSYHSPMLCFIHPKRTNIYDEAEACIRLDKDSVDVITDQINGYKSEKYPGVNGLISGGIMYRKHNDPAVVDTMETWWGEVKNKSHRDQLSFNYVCWKKDFQYDICKLNIWENEYFEHHFHKE